MAATTPAGVLCAALLHTRDVAASARHYQSVFGWTAVPDAAGTSFTLGGQRVAAACAVVAGVDGWVLVRRRRGCRRRRGAGRARRRHGPRGQRRFVAREAAAAGERSRRRRARPLRPRRRRGRGAHRRARVGVVDGGAQPHAREGARFLLPRCCSGSSPRSRCRRTPRISSAGGAEPRLEGFFRSVGAGARRHGGSCCSTWTISPGPRSRSWMPADASSSARSTCRRRA